MVVNYGFYSTINPANGDKTRYSVEDYEKKYNVKARKYDANHFQNLLDKHQYREAYTYASNYVPNDPKQQQEYLKQLNVLKNNAGKAEALYSKIDTIPGAREATDFSDAVFKDGGLEKLSNNKYADKFIDWKRNFGSIIEQDNDGNKTIKAEATSLSMTFKPKKQIGIFGWDWIAADNNNNIDNFYEVSGLNEQQLKAKGVNVIHNEDGGVTIRFDKSNELANKIMVNVNKFEDSALRQMFGNDSPQVSIIGYDSQGKALDDEYLNSNTTRSSLTNTGITRYTENGIIYKGSTGNEGIRRMIEDASNVKQNTLESLSLDKKVYTSTVTNNISDGWAKIQNDYKKGLLTPAAYNAALDKYQSEIKELLTNIGAGQYQIYTNAYNENPLSDGVLREAGSETHQSILSHISANVGDIVIKGMIVGGKKGIVIEVPAIQKSNKDLKSDMEIPDAMLTARYQYFIPGVLNDKVQNAIDSDTTSRCAQTINEMQDWNYTYTTNDGIDITPDGEGTFTIGNQTGKSVEDVGRYINKDMALADAKMLMAQQYVNNNKEFVNAKGYEARCRELAYSIANEMYPDVPLTLDNSTMLSMTDIFNMKGTGSDILPEYDSKMAHTVSTKLSELFDCYERLMANINLYTN